MSSRMGFCKAGAPIGRRSLLLRALGARLDLNGVRAEFGAHLGS